LETADYMDVRIRASEKTGKKMKILTEAVWISLEKVLKQKEAKTAKTPFGSS
jgi:hypothetical protein